MQKILKIAQREYIETVKTKTFIFMIVMLPFMIGVIIFFTDRLNRSKGAGRPPLTIAVTDLSNELSTHIKDSFDEHNASPSNRRIKLQEVQTDEDSGTVEERGKAQLRQGRLDAYVVVDADILEGPGKIRTYTYELKPANQDALGAIENTVKNAVKSLRYEKRDLDLKLMEGLRRVPTQRIDLGPADEERVETEGDRIVRMIAPFFFMYLLFLGIFSMGQQMLSSIIEEKNSRVIEVLLSALSPFELMAGKILGLVGVGLTVVSLWGFSTYFAARHQGLNVDVGAAMLSCFVIYYVLAFLLFGSLMVGIGSICNTIKETQSLLKPVMILCVVPIIAWQNIIQDPNGTLARALSFFPLTTPMVMILRLSSGSDIWMVETLGSIVLLAAAVLGSIWVAARVFRTGILMYGKRPGLREVGRWLKQA